jgi:hypothetical protein
VLTNHDGGFAIAGNYTCTAGHQVYLYVHGGNSSGSGSNAAIGLMASLGACPASGTFTSTLPFVFVNEVSTVAAAYAMAGSAADATHVSNSGPLSDTGISDATNLVGIATGFANATLPSNPHIKVPQSQINTLANILAACVNSSGPESITCNTLFTHARSGGASGELPNDTATAAIYIAHNPNANVSALYELQPRFAPPFKPNLGSVPSDFHITLADESLELASSSPRH